VTRAEKLAAVLAEHSYTYPDSFCECGAMFDKPWHEWRAHVAAALDAALTAQEPTTELADYEPSDGHLHTCPRGGNCDCAGLLYCIAQDAERDAIRGLADGRADLADRIAAAWVVYHAAVREGLTVQPTALRAALGDPAATLAEVKAAAWDEGYVAGWHQGNAPPYTLRTPNPYRIESEAGR